MLRPLPDKSNAEALAKLGWLTALRNARLDALHELRDAVTRMQSNNAHSANSIDIQAARAALDRIEEINALEQQ